MIFNVWSINKLLGADDKSNWKNIVDEQEKKLLKQHAEKHTRFMENLKKEDPKLYNEWKTEDQKFAELQAARMKYEESNDIDTYILFWERLWENGGLTFLGSRWQFELADLYILITLL